MNFSTTKKTVPINNVISNKWNPNVQSEQMFKKGIASMQEFGMLGSILVRETAGCYEILDGEHRWKYAKELGYTELTVESLGEIDDNRAKVLTVLLNNLRGKDDIEKRAAIFKSLDEGQLQLLPFTTQEIENEKALFEFDFSQYDSIEPEIPADEMPHILSFKFSDKEWEVVNEALQHAKANLHNEKQWLMVQIGKYLRENSLLSGFTSELSTKV